MKSYHNPSNSLANHPPTNVSALEPSLVRRQHSMGDCLFGSYYIKSNFPLKTQIGPSQTRVQHSHQTISRQAGRPSNHPAANCQWWYSRTIPCWSVVQPERAAGRYGGSGIPVGVRVGAAAGYSAPVPRFFPITHLIAIPIALLLQQSSTNPISYSTGAF